MKISNPTVNSMELKTNGLMARIVGVVLFAAGIAVLAGLGTADNALARYGLGAVLALGGVAAFLFAPDQTILIDKDTALISVRKSSILTKSSNDYPIASAVRVEMRMTQRVSNDQNNGTTIRTEYSVFLILNDGTEFLITNYSPAMINGVIAVGNNKAQEAGSKVSAFLGIPFTQGGQFGMQNTVSTPPESFIGTPPQTFNQPTQPQQPQPGVQNNPEVQSTVEEPQENKTEFPFQ